MFGLAMIVWVSLVGGDPLLDPWATAEPEIDVVEVTSFCEHRDPKSWSVEDGDLLNPFEQDILLATPL